MKCKLKFINVVTLIILFSIIEIYHCYSIMNPNPHCIEFTELPFKKGKYEDTING